MQDGGRLRRMIGAEVGAGVAVAARGGWGERVRDGAELAESEWPSGKKIEARVRRPPVGEGVPPDFQVLFSETLGEFSFDDGDDMDG